MGGVVSAGLGIIGGITGMGSADKAAKAQAAAIQKGLDFATGVYGTQQSALAPYIGTGGNALASISQLYGLPAPAGSTLPSGNAMDAYKAYAQTPFYQFPLQQGTEALNRSGAARGLTLSGGQANALQQYGQGYGASNFSNYINSLSQLANLGPSGINALANTGSQLATPIISGETGVGTAQASGIIGRQNALNSILNQGGNLLNPLLGGGSFMSQNQSSYSTLQSNPFLNSSNVANPLFGGSGAV